jgi:amidohydrolase
MGERVRTAARACGDRSVAISPYAEERREILAAIERDAEPILDLSRWMSRHPELALKEYEASTRYVRFLGARGFEIERATAGLETAFLARRGSAKPVCSIALLAEMDALPEIGHACGHSLSGPASLLAASALNAVLSDDALGVLVVGTPAEEIGAGKRELVDAGVFAEVDAAMMAHASDMRRAHRLFLGNRKFEFTFHGRAAHAAAYPEQGVNALDGVIAFFVAIGLLRQQLPSDARIHGIVSEGGQAPNIIPERAAARVWVRALDDAILEDVAVRVQECARGAAAATGNRLEIELEAGASPSMRANLALASLYRKQLQQLGLEETPNAPSEAIGSSDITHVSRVVPTIHPDFPIGSDLKLHTREFAEAVASPQGEAGLLEAARALALTAHEFACCEGVRRAVAEEGADS